MMDFLITSTVCLSTFLAVYYLLLQREKIYRFNRFYLLGSIVASFAIPFMSIPVYVKSEAATLPPEIFEQPATPQIQNQPETNYLYYVLLAIYSLVLLILVLRFIINVRKQLYNVAASKSINYKKAKLVLLEEQVLPHTFLNYIFLNKDDYNNGRIEKELLAHELAHVTQKHTLDVLVIELLKTLFWFNPLFYFYKHAIQLNHEFLADESALNLSIDAVSYQELLLQKVSLGPQLSLASHLNFSLTKKRFIMMTKTTTKSKALVLKLATLPLLTGLMLFFCVETVAQEKSQKKQSGKTEKTSTQTVQDDKIYKTSDLTQNPEFPGGLGAFYKEVVKEYKIPKVDKDMTARIYVSFIVEKDGSMSNMKVDRAPEGVWGDEAIRTLSEIKTKWIPGNVKGKPVRTAYHLPITVNVKS